MRLDGKTVFLTGAGSGIGRATARRAVEEGADVLVTDIDVERGEETVEDLNERTDTTVATFHELDVREREEVQNVVDVAAETHEGIDVFVNNAGILGPTKTLTETTVEERERLLDINVRGVWNGCQAAVSVMRERGGAIVNVSSLAGKLGVARMGTYSMSKGAVLNFTRALAAEVGRHDIRVNAVCPGLIETEMTEGSFDRYDDPEAARAAAIDSYPLGRLGEPEEVANCIIFLASDEASFVSGQGLSIDGGYSAY